MNTTDPNKDFYPGYEKFAGNPHTSLNGILFYLITIAMLYRVITYEAGIPTVIISRLLMIPLCYIGIGLTMYHFYLSGDKLIIKNHYFFWIEKQYDISQIVEIIIGRPPKGFKSMQLLARDKGFKHRFYSAGTLRKHHWIALTEKLQELKVPVKMQP
jgi:hypothetical protein